MSFLQNVHLQHFAHLTSPIPFNHLIAFTWIFMMPHVIRCHYWFLWFNRSPFSALGVLILIITFWHFFAVLMYTHVQYWIHFSFLNLLPVFQFHSFNSRSILFRFMSAALRASAATFFKDLLSAIAASIEGFDSCFHIHWQHLIDWSWCTLDHLSSYQFNFNDKPLWLNLPNLDWRSFLIFISLAI